MKAFLRLACIVAGICGCVTVGAVSQSAVDTSKHATQANDVVQRFMLASGGAELAKIKAEKWKGTLIRGEAGAISLETLATAGGKWLYNQIFAYGERVSYGCDGAHAWIQDARGVTAMPPEIRQDLEILLDPRFAMKLTERYPQMAITGSEKVGGKEATVVSARSREGAHREFAFDRQSGMLLRAGDLFFEDYRDVGKVKRPFAIALGREDGPDSLRLKMQIAEIRHEAAADEAAFRMPACSLPPTKPALYTLRTEAVVGLDALEACVGVYRSAADPKVLYTVTVQGRHLMIERTGWGARYEILPESETSYFMRFLNREFHFVKDATGRVNALEIGSDRAQKALRIK